METKLPGADSFFDEPEEPVEIEAAHERIRRLMEAVSGRDSGAPNGFLTLIRWMASTADKERQVILYVFREYGGIIGKGDVNRIINGCGVCRSVYFRALRGFDKFFPGVIER